MSIRQVFSFVLLLIRKVPSRRLLVGGYLASAVLLTLAESAGIFVIIPLLQVLQGEVLKFSSPIVEEAISLITGDGDARAVILRVAIFTLVLAVLRAALEFSSRYLLSLTGIHVSHYLTLEACRVFLDSNVFYAESRPEGQGPAIIYNFIGRSAIVVEQSLSAISAVALIAVYSALMSLVSLPMTAMAVVFIVFVFFATRLISRRQQYWGTRMTDASIDASQRLIDAFRALRTIRVFNAENRVFGDISDSYFYRLAIQRKLMFFNAMGLPAFTLFGALFVFATLVLGSQWFADQNEDWISHLIVFLVILYRLMSPAAQLNSARLAIAGNVQAIHDYNDYVDSSHANRKLSGSTPVRGVQEGIAFESVNFSYTDTGKPALHDLSFSVAKGETLALVGRSGSGKSTIAALLCRFTDPTSGRIRIDDQDLRELDIDDWMNCLAIVSQDTLIQGQTVAEALRFAKPEASDDAVRDAAVKAQLGDLLSASEDGIHRSIGEASNQVSAGQGQRLSIARALLKEPDVLILDEATSNLDNETEQALRDVLDERKGKKVTIIIAHRLKNVVDADAILVLEEGRVVEQGTHAALREQGGVYERFVQLNMIDGEV
ncbi:MAG: ABC transporter ATP-binding protein [Pseudomonadota bacterium]